MEYLRAERQYKDVCLCCAECGDEYLYPDEYNKNMRQIYNCFYYDNVMFRTKILLYCENDCVMSCVVPTYKDSELYFLVAEDYEREDLRQLEKRKAQFSQNFATFILAFIAVIIAMITVHSAIINRI